MAGDTDEIVAASVFRALADPTRRQILQALRKGELAAGDIASKASHLGTVGVWRHLAVLKATGLVSERREANRVMYSLVAERLAVCARLLLVSSLSREELLTRHQGRKKPKAPEKATARLGEKPSGKLSARSHRASQAPTGQRQKRPRASQLRTDLARTKVL